MYFHILSQDKVNIGVCKNRNLKIPRIIIPEFLIPVLFRYYQETTLVTHLKIFKTIKRIKEHFIWKRINADTSDTSLPVEIPNF